MKFLDLNGLTHFFGKVKTWAGNNYLSLKGGTINGNINISGNVSALQFKKTNGTSTQVLIADGSVKGIGSANGVAGLDANGRIPLAQLGNLDTSLFKLVTSLPSSGESNKIYIVKDGSDANDVYQEYYYTNGAWEKIGTHAVKVDLTPYAKKTEAVTNVEFTNIEADGSYITNTSIRNLVYTLGDGRKIVAPVPLAEPRTTGARPYVGQNGFMRSSDKAKLDGIADGANNYTLPTASASVLGGILIGYGTSGRNYAVLLDGSGKAYVNVPWTDTTYDLSPYAKKDEAVNKATALFNNNSIYITFKTITEKVLGGFELFGATSESSGVMSAPDKTKLDGISSGATADSAITTAEIDALFA